MYPLKDGLKNDTTFQISDSKKQRNISKNSECVQLFAATYAHWQRVKDACGSAKNSVLVRILQLKLLVASVVFVALVL